MQVFNCVYFNLEAHKRTLISKESPMTSSNLYMQTDKNFTVSGRVLSKIQKFECMNCMNDVKCKCDIWTLVNRPFMALASSTLALSC